MEWWYGNSPSKKMFKMQLSAGKVMCTVFWDRKEVILLDFSGTQTDHQLWPLNHVTDWAEGSNLQSQAREEGSLSLATPAPIPLWSALEHIANPGWTVLLHPLYRPDLALSDFHIFGQMNDGLHRQHFPSNNAIREAVKQWVTTTCADFYEHNRQALVHHRWKCIAN